MNELAKFGICNLLVEGGSKIFTSFLNEDLVDQIIIFRSNSFIGSKGQDLLTKNYQPKQKSFFQSFFCSVRDNTMEVLERKE